MLLLLIAMYIPGGTHFSMSFTSCGSASVLFTHTRPDTSNICMFVTLLIMCAGALLSLGY